MPEPHRLETRLGDVTKAADPTALTCQLTKKPELVAPAY
jgi:hypothetical protein